MLKCGYNVELRFIKILHLPEFPMLLDLLFSDPYLVFHIKINDDSCNLLLDALFISLDPKHDPMYKLEQRQVTMSVSLHT